MIAGVGLFGTLSAALAAWFAPEGQATNNEIAALREEIAPLRTAVERIQL